LKDLVNGFSGQTVLRSPAIVSVLADLFARIKGSHNIRRGERQEEKQKEEGKSFLLGA
jgi:hypothetical protein